MCLVVTPAIKGLADKIRQEYPEACERNGFNDQMCAEWVGLYNNTNDKSPDEVPSMKILVSFIERLRGKEGKSFLQEIQSEERLAAIQQEMDEIKAKAIADGTFMKAPNGKPTKLTERQWLQVRTKAFKKWFGDWEKVAKFAASFINSTNTLTIDRNEYTDEFRRIQEESRSLLPEEVSEYHRGRLQGRSGDSFKRSLGRVYEGLLSRGTSSSLGSWSLRGKDNQFKIRRVNGSLFHDIFEINRNYLENGELVDLHDDYSTCKCYLSDDGLCGFAIEPDGNLVSVFSLNPSNKKGFLYAIKDFIREEGATHLDAYASKNQNLEEIYAKTLGFHVASEMDYNMEYDHDNIAENHGRPKVVFMVNQQVTRKSFDKDSYDDAAGYAESSVKALDAGVSKVVDENGEPKIMLRTDDAGKSIMGRGDGGAFFATDKLLVAGSYASDEADLYKGFVNLKNPYIVKGESHGFFFEYKGKETTVQKAQLSLMQDGYDGVYFERTWDVGDYADGEPDDDYWANNVAMFNPNQFKSATANSGEFSDTNNSILASPESVSNQNDFSSFAEDSVFNRMSESLKNAIKTGNWTAKDLNEFENLIKEIKDGKISVNQSLGEVRGEMSSFSEIHAGASLILGRKTRTEEEERGNPQTEYERDAREGKLQEAALEAWAKAADLWLNDYEDPKGNKASDLESLLNSQWNYLDQGSEAEVYEYEEDTVLKSINLSHNNDNPGKLLDSIALFNSVFPNTAMTVVGFGRDSLGHFRVIVTQPYIVGSELTNTDLLDFKRKYSLEDGNLVETPEGYIEISDLSPYNIIKDSEGNYFVIDADLKYTPKSRLDIYEDVPVELVESMVQEQDAREAMDQRESSDPDLNKKFGNHDEVTVSEILGNLLESDSPFAGFIEALQKNLGDLGNIKIKLVPNSHASVYGIAGVYSTLENTIYINRNANYKGKGGKVDATILHEIIHAVVANSLQTAKHREELGKIFDEVREKLFKKYNVSSFEELPEYLRKGKLYGLQNLDEFAAEFFTNGEFVLELNDRETFGDKSDRGSIISRLVEWIKSLLPKGVTDTYKQAGNILEDILLNSGGTIQDYRDLLENGESSANTQDTNNPPSPSQQSGINDVFKQGIETIASYYNEGSNGFPGIPNRIHNKLKDHFTKGTELTDDDYREMSEYINIVSQTASEYGTILKAEPKKGLPKSSGKKSQTTGQSQQSHIAKTVQDRVTFTTSAGGYPQRTKENADWSDVTIDFTESNGSSGATQKWAGNKYVHFQLHNEGEPAYDAQEILDAIKKAGLPTENIKLNIAGSEIGKLRGSQAAYNNEITRLIKGLLDLGVTIQEIRSGGQTGIDEAGIIAAKRLGITASVHASKGWVFRDKDGKDNPGKEAFMERFLEGRSSTDVQGDTNYSYRERTPAPEGAVYNPSRASEGRKVERPKSDSYDNALKAAVSRIADFYNTFTPQQIKDRGTMIADYFSDIIDDYLSDEIDRLVDEIEDPNIPEKQKEQDRALLNLLRDPVNGRKFAANKLQIGNIVAEIKRRVKRNAENMTGKQQQLWQNTLEYFDELFENQASLEIEEQEGIRIIGLKTADVSLDESINDARNDGDDDTGHIVSGNDGWLFQTRFEDPSNSLSKSVRRMLYNIERGKDDVDDLGHQRKYSSGQIYATFLSYLAKNMQSPDDFMRLIRPDEYTDDSVPGFSGEDLHTQYPEGYPQFPVLEKMREQYPWVDQVIQRLTNDWLNEEWNPDTAYPSTFGAMASQFYTNFRKAFIPYAKIQVGDGKFGVTPLNHEMSERCQKDKLTANYNNGITLTDLSIYGQDLVVNKENAAKLAKMISDELRKNTPAELYSLHQDITSGVTEVEKEDSEEYDRMIDHFIYIMESFGISANREGIIALLAAEDKGLAIAGILKDLSHIAKSIEKLSDDKIKDFDYLQDLKYPSGEPMWKNFFKDRGIISDDTYMQSFYDSASKKTRYSYSSDNYLQKTFRGIYNKDLAARRKFMDERFKKYEWFYNHKTNTWRNKWLEILYNEENLPDVLPYRNINNITETNTNMFGEKTSRVRDYSEWTPTDIWLVQNRGYNDSDKFSYYLAPIFSDSPMSMTLRGPVLSEDDALDAIVSTVDQELWRIKLVNLRARQIERTAKSGKEESKVLEIANFDGKRGKEFCFIPELNNYVLPSTGEKFIDALMRMKRNEDIEGRRRIYTADEIYAVKRDAVRAIMEQKAIEYAKENESNYPHKEGNLELPANFMQTFMNMVYANISIIQLTTVDLAYYKTNVDFGKRFKEVYAGGIELNTNSRYGMKYENSILLKDDEITSPSYEVIARVIDKSENLSRKDKERIKKVFKKVNIADAQAIRSMYSFRSVLDMMGKWDKRMENALKNFEEGRWQSEDFDIIFQTIKPFMYTVAERNNGFGGKIPVPHQHKNSEVCALMMYSLIMNNLNSPVYSALSEFMEKTVGADGRPLIHMAQFESAGKVGNQGVIDIRFNASRLMKAIDKQWNSKDKKDAGIRDLIDKINWEKLLPNTLDNAGDNYDAIKKQLDKMLDRHINKKGKEEERISQKDYNRIIAYLRPEKDEIKSILEQKAIITDNRGIKTINPERVHTTSMENYYQAQPTPAHHIDAEAVFGSQGRNIAPADLPDDFEMTLVGKNNKTLTLKGKDAIVDFYYELLNENLIEDFFYKEDGDRDISLKSMFESKDAFRKAVENIVRGNPKYGSDFIEALKTDSDGNFVLSPNSPTMFTLMQEIVTSLFKNHITKQKINGAALIQAAGIGLDESLRLVEDENTGKVIGAQCLMPLTSKEFFEPFMEERTINGKKVMILDPNKLKEAGLEKAIGYRIPTENTSSMLPLIITGFTPLQNGSMIVLPAEITALAGSDFDVDKMFIMLSEFYMETHDMQKAREEWADENYYTTAVFSNPDLSDPISSEDPLEFRNWFKKNQGRFLHDKPKVRRVEYNFDKSPKDNGRRARNNLVIQMIFSMITEGKNDSLLNPQGFDNFKSAAKLNRILEDPTLKEKLLENYESASNEVTPSAEQIRKTFLDHYKHWPENERKKLERTLNSYPDEIIIGMYIETLKINGAEGTEDVIDVLLKSSGDEREDFVSAYSTPESPIYPQTFAHSHARNMAGMNQIGIGAVQASMTAKYQRVSIDLRENQQFIINGRPITDVDVSDGGRRLKNCGEIVGACADNGKDPNLSDAGSTTDTLPILEYMLRCGLTHEEAVLVLNSPIMKLGKYNASAMRSLGYHKSPVGNVTTKMLAKAAMNPYSCSATEIENIEALCYRVICQAEAMEPLTKISRADSPNGAMQNSFAKARVQQYMVDFFNAKMGQTNFPFKRIQGVLDNTTVDVSKGENAVREALKKQPMALLHGFYGLGINSINYLGGKQFFMLKKEFDDAIVKPLLYNQHEHVYQADLEDLVDKIYLQYITYVLSSSPLFGDETNADGTVTTMKEKRDYYLTSFARDFTTTMQKYPEIYSLLGSVLQREGNRIILKDVGSLGKRQKEIVSRRLDALFSIGEEGSELRQAGRNLAKDLLMFAYYDSGLNFNHDSYSTRLSTYFLTQFPEYVDILRKLDSPMDDEHNKRFIEQFLVTNPKAAHYIMDSVADKYMVKGKIVIDMNDYQVGKDFINMVMSPNPKYTGIQPYAYIRSKGSIWILDQEKYDANPATAEYIRLDDYPTSVIRAMYNMNKSVAELSEEYRDKKNTPLPPAQKDPVGENDYDIEHNSGYDNPILDNPEELYGPPSDGGNVDIDYNSILNDPNIPNSQTPAGQFNDSDETYDDQDFLEKYPCGL